MKRDHKTFASALVVFAVATCFVLTGCAGSFFGKAHRDFVEVADISQVPESDPFTIRDARIERDSLKFIASYGGGCREHVFTLYAARSKDSANTGMLYVQHNANNDLCRAVINADTVKFSLAGIKKALGLRGEATLVLPTSAPVSRSADSGISVVSLKF
jgi:hypothetical protein